MSDLPPALTPSVSNTKGTANQEVQASVKAPATMCQLPSDLQSYILALAGAPLNTCRASVSILSEVHLTAIWLAALTPEPLLLASQGQKWDACLYLLTSPSYQASAREMCSSLSLAAQAGQLELVQALLEQGAWQQWHRAPFKPTAPLTCRVRLLDPAYDSCCESHGFSHPLVSAAAGGHLAICALLLQQQPAPHPDRQVEGIALRKAAERGDRPMMQLLIDGLPCIGSPHMWRDSFRAAVRAGQTEAVRFFLQREASHQHRGLHLVDAVDGGSLEVLQLLLDMPNQWVRLAEWGAALAEAAMTNNVRALELLLSRAPQENWDDNWYVDMSAVHPLDLAGHEGHVEVLTTLLRRGMSQRSIQSALCCATDSGHVSCMQLLVQHGAGYKHFVMDLSDPLRSALRSNRPEAVDWLLQQGAHIEPTGCNTTALTCAVRVPALPCIAVLLRHGASDKDGSALYFAARQGQVQMVQLLFHAGPAIVKLRTLGRRVNQAKHITRLQLALCGAAATGQLEVVKYLLDMAGTPSTAAAAATPPPSTVKAAAPPPLPPPPQPGQGNARMQAGHVPSEEPPPASIPSAPSAGAEPPPGCSSDPSKSCTHLLNKALEAAVIGRNHYLIADVDGWLKDNPLSEYGAVAQLLISHGANPAAEGAHLITTALKRATIRRESSNELQEILDVMLRALAAAPAIAVNGSGHAQLAADMSQNLDALCSLVRFEQPCQSYDVSWLELAVDSNMPGLVGLLLRHRSYPGLSAHRALQIAIDKGYTAIATMLVEHGGDVGEDQRVALLSMAHLQPGEVYEGKGLARWQARCKQQLRMALAARGLIAGEVEEPGPMFAFGMEDEEQGVWWF